MSLMDFLGLALAVHQTVNVVRYSALFAWLRDRVEIGQSVVPAVLSTKLTQQIDDFIYALVKCPWCLSLHAAWFYLIGIFGPAWLILPAVIYFLMWTSAAAQVANLIHYYTSHRGIKQ